VIETQSKYDPQQKKNLEIPCFERLDVLFGRLKAYYLTKILRNFGEKVLSRIRIQQK
jgi:hypothetical protein